MNSQQLTLQHDRSALVNELMAHGAKFKGDYCTCIFHEDKHPSAVVKCCDDGAYRLFCYVCPPTAGTKTACWDIFDVRAKVRGCSLGDILREVREYEAPPPVEKPKTVYPSLDVIIAHYPDVEITYKYTHPETNVVELAVIRYRKDGRKRFAQCSPTEGGWIAGRPQGKLPLYNRSRVAKSDTVVCVEGEKAVHALTEVGIVATTSPMGAGKAAEADWSPLKEKTVYLWPDNDPIDEKTGISTGEQHMRDVQGILESLDCRLRWIDQRELGLPPKGDVVDFLKANGGSLSDKEIAVRLVLDEARSIDGAAELEAHIAAVASGQWRNVPWPWPDITYLAQALLPGTVTALCGDPGATKSFLLLEAAWHWHLTGERVALFEMEDDRTYHLQRVLAQLEQEAQLTDIEWIHKNPEKAKTHFANQRDVLDTFARTITTAPDRLVTRAELIEWLERQCKAGASICCIDSVTAAEPTLKPWIADQKFIFQAKAIVRRYGARLIYVIHPRISNEKAGSALSRMAGGAAYSRFSHTVLWLNRLDEPVINGRVFRRNEYSRMATYNRTIHIAKARNGVGTGSKLAYMFEPSTLCFTELGMIIKDENAALRQTLPTSGKVWNADD